MVTENQERVEVYDDGTQMPVHSFQILMGGRYVGAVFAYPAPEGGLLYTHSIQRHETPMFETAVAATHDFWDTKQQLPAAVHRVIFGE